ncbi:MAG: chromosomal replication initiator protein DnaA [Selenomonadaceae bacterium]|nr:chromosomal replication initiator protein DnaA [Selenomonadaceae bacterium]MBP3721932.1 chromosomal replication initiator protein DnaA [Selenomonadaceae bacterium]
MDEKEQNALFEKILAKMKENLSESATKQWISPLKIKSVTDEKIEFAAPNKLIKEWINDKYIKLLEFAVSEVTQNNLNIIVTAEKSSDEKSKEKETVTVGELFASDAPTISSHTGIEWPEPISPGDPSTLIDRYTFETFVTGKSNQLAHAAAVAVAQKPGEAYNPFFMYGGVGLGKTHLMHAIGHRILENDPKKRVLYVSGEKFTNEMINSIRDKSQEVFRMKYRTVDVLMVDDIQFISGKEGTQEEFFHTFNTLKDANKQIIISSDKPPKELARLEERLRSRFEWGLIADVQPPDLEMRVAILQKKAEAENMEVDNEVLLYIASRIDTNIRELEGALTRAVAYASLKNQKISKELVQESLKNIFNGMDKRTITLDMIENVIVNHFNVSKEDLKSKKRSKEVTFPRQIAMYLSRDLAKATLPQIGSYFGGRDHTTVMHACEKIDAEKKKDTKLDTIIKELTEKLGA